MNIRRVAFIAAIILLILSGLGGLGYAYYYHYWPNKQMVEDPFHGSVKPIFYRGEQLEGTAEGSAESLKLPFSLVKANIDPAMLYEDTSQSLIITTQEKVLRLRTDQLTATVNDKPFQLKFPLSKTTDILYVPIDPLRDLYGISLIEADKTGAVFIRKQGEAEQWAELIPALQRKAEPIPIRESDSIKAPIVSYIKPTEQVLVWSEQNSWYRVQQNTGHIGYIPKTKLQLERIEVTPVPIPKSSFVPWKPIGGKINLTWQQVGERKVDTSKIDPMPGLNVISPQWFHLEDGDGNLKNLGDAAFAKWANSQNFQVWALFSNGFEPKRTTEALSTYDKRLKMIKQLVAYAALYKIQGINIDFENVYLKDKANMVQFVREAAPLLHEQGLVVSIDVAVKDGSETYSLFMDRRTISPFVDYMMVMTYDEHWAASQKAGSVASLPWVEKGITQIMKEDAVPASKILLGIPFYTRIWTEQLKDGKPTVTSKAVSMEAVQKIIHDKKLTPLFLPETGQNYVEYSEDGKLNKIWIEDTISIKSRVELAKKLDLAGVASWSRGFETQDIWALIQSTLERKP